MKEEKEEAPQGSSDGGCGEFVLYWILLALICWGAALALGADDYTCFDRAYRSAHYIACGGK
jgi:hypothetical protein